MDTAELRLECLKLAVDLHGDGLGTLEACLSTAEQFMAFVEEDRLPARQPNTVGTT